MIFAFKVQSNISNNRCNLNPFLNESKSIDNVHQRNTRQTYKDKLLCKSYDDLATTPTKTTVDGSLERRLSPKVFTNKVDVTPVSQSLENLKTQNELYEDLEPVNNFMKKHSLQDLTVLSTDAVSQVILYNIISFFK